MSTTVADVTPVKTMGAVSPEITSSPAGIGGTISDWLSKVRIVSSLFVPEIAIDDPPLMFTTPTFKAVVDPVPAEFEISNPLGIAVIRLVPEV